MMTDKQKKTDERWMRRALQLAKRGAATVSPNPMVGAVIVRNGVKLGEGWHVRPGEGHAEVNAFRSLATPADARGATLYVTLEPCSTYGRTPPCCEAILSHGIARVVVGCTDPNPSHAGRGLKLLAEHGLEVRCGVLEKACCELNESFFHWITTGRPFVLLKMAETLDGKTATAGGVSQWITSETARKRVADLRLRADAILAGAETWQLDHPRFTARNADGKVLKTPRRIVASHHPERLALPEGWESVQADSTAEWDAFLKKLGREQVTFLLVEGGGELAASLLRAGAVDRVEFHLAPKLLGGRDSRTAMDGDNPSDLTEAVELQEMSWRRLGCDLLVTGIPANRMKQGE